VRSIVERRPAEQIEVMGSIELPNDEQMRETLGVSEPECKFWQNLEHTSALCFVLRPFGISAVSLVRAFHKSNRLGNKHKCPCLHLSS
jgi:hypothetical protein